MEIINKELVEQLLNQKQILVAVTKTVGVEKMEVLYKYGSRHFGENRVETFLEKIEYFKNHDDIKWHYIGSIQSRQVKKLIQHIDYLHALSSHSVAKEIEKHALKPIKCFIQVNCSNETQKSGLEPEEAVQFYQEMLQHSKIQVVGLMTMAAYTDSETEIRSCFRKLATIRDEINPNLKLSMGMSNDYEIAVAEGSDFIRVGSALFEMK